MNKTIKFNNKEYDLSAMTDLEIDELNMSVSEVNDNIRSQLDRAKSSAYSNGVYSEPIWFRRASDAKRAHGRMLQSINMERRRRNELAKQQNKNNDAINIFLKKLYDNCLEQLPEEVFLRIFNSSLSHIDDGCRLHVLRYFDVFGGKESIDTAL